MRKRSGRQKFNDLRMLTFQDWILPNYNANLHNKKGTMSSRPPPLFSYTKMETCPPLSTITSQFAWAGHRLPDLVQEQSDRLLRRLQRPRTAVNRIPNYRNSQMKGHKISRPSTALPSPTRHKVPEFVAVLGVNGKKWDSEEEVTSCFQRDEVEKEDKSNSPSSDRSCSPDFMHDLYKEYEEKISSDCIDREIQTDRSQMERSMTKLLRKPGLHYRIEKRQYCNHQSNGESKFHCVVKLPKEHSECEVITYDSTTPPSRKIEPGSLKHKETKSETWIDLSQLYESSEDEQEDDLLEEGLRRTRIAPTMDIAKPMAQNDCRNVDDQSQPSVPKPTRPSSSKNPRKHSKTQKTKRRKRKLFSLSNMEESAKEQASATPTSTTRTHHLKCPDKLREEIETQMSKLDMETDINGNKIVPVQRNIIRRKDLTPQLRTRSLGSICACTQISQPRIPVKKVPIQILSDPFMMHDINHGDARLQPDGNEGKTSNGRKLADAGVSSNIKIMSNSKRQQLTTEEQAVTTAYMGGELERIKAHLKAKGIVISSAKLRRGLTRPTGRTYDECIHSLPASTKLNLLHS